MAQQFQMDVGLLEDMAIANTVVDGTTHGTKTLREVTDQGTLNVHQAILVTELTVHGLTLTIDVRGDAVTLTGVTTLLSKSALAHGMAEALHDLADKMQAGAAEISTIAGALY
jgi:hypothetical protein